MSFPMGLGGSGPLLRSATAREAAAAAPTSFPSLSGSTRPVQAVQASRHQQSDLNHVPREPQVVGQRSSTRPPAKGEDSSLPELNGGGPLLLQQVRGPPIPGSLGRSEHSRFDVGAAAAVEYQPLQVGLENLGNTCFMNTSLQCLLHIQPLISFFLAADIERAINLQSPSKGALARSFAQLCRDIFSKQPKSIAPTNFQRAVGALAPHLLDFQQQDCQEFLRFLLDGMSEDLCRPAAAAPAATPAATPAPTHTATPTAAAVAVAPSPAAASVELPALGPPGKAPASAAPSRLRAAALGASQTELPDRGQGTGAGQGQGQGQGQEDGASAALGAMARLSLSAPTLPAQDARHQQQQEQQQQQGELDDIDTSPMQRHRRRVVNRADPAAAPGPGGLAPKDSAKRGALTASWPETTAPETTTPAAPPVLPACNQGGGASPAPPPTLEEAARLSWAQYLRKNDSIITDLFAGQLQSTIECQTCLKTSTCFDPFLDLSVPIPKPEGAAQTRMPYLGRAKAEAKACTLHECLAKFTSVEVLDEDNAYSCEHCKQKRKGHKRLSLYKLPKILVIHIKRFRFNSLSREKLSTDVHFPSTSLDLGAYCSADGPHLAQGRPSPVYDLFAVSSHSGSLNGGHYIAHCDINGGSPGPGPGPPAQVGPNWVSFNDARTAQTNLGSIAGPSAYVLFYRQRGGS